MVFFEEEKKLYHAMRCEFTFQRFFYFIFPNIEYMYIYKDTFGETELTLSTEKFLNRNVLLSHMINEKILIYSNKSAIKEENNQALPNLIYT